MGSGCGIIDLQKNYAFYRAHHINAINIIINGVLAWPIVFFGILLLHFTPPVFHIAPSIAALLPSTVADALVLNYGFLLVVFYSWVYTSIDIRAGTMAAVLCFLSWVGSSLLANSLGYSLSCKVVLSTQFVFWVIEGLGHAKFEKRAPNLFQNPFEAVVLHPFFISLHVLQILFNYEPYSGFEEGVQKRVVADIKEWKAKAKRINN